MFQDKYVFAQLTAFLNRTQFNNYVRKYDGNRYVKRISPIQRPHYITSSYTYQFFEKNIFCIVLRVKDC